jgi:dipeptidyl aminopeptidase/acylaminoacyl peptidase
MVRLLKVLATIFILAIATGTWILMKNNPPAPDSSITDTATTADPTVFEAPYGTWESPLTAASIFAVSDNISYLTAVDDQLYFIESRASAQGRSILTRLGQDQSVEQLTASEISVRTRVHEYGGRPYLVLGDQLFYSRFDDQKIYQQSPDGSIRALTRDGLRYMQCIADTHHNQLICVREDHTAAGEPVNTLVAINLEHPVEEKVVFEGTDFVSSPQLSPDGLSIAFITWSHPNMPWDDTQLRVIHRDSQGKTRAVVEVPQSGNVAFSDPAFASDGTLYFLADFTNWQTLYRLNNEGTPELVLEENIEIGDYAFESNASAIITYTSEGMSYLARVNLTTPSMTNIGQPFSSAGSITATADAVYFIASTPASQDAIYQLEGDSYQVLYRPSGPEVQQGYLSLPQSMVFPTVADEEAYGFFYPPQNENFIGTKNTLPPLIVKVHGGPVAAARSTLSPAIQFWTSRGFAVFDVNHRGSTGYGRAFRKKLYPNWGIVDIEDASNGVRWLAGQGAIDADKVAIRGGSAGGYTTLAALAFEDSFKAGASYFGISDLEILARDTHKFESRFLDQLIGPYPAAIATYKARSPINSVDRITSPLLLLQGLDDEVVPPNQSEMIFEALKKNCIPTAYIAFEGEGHGFRQPANNIRAQNSELSFYGQIFGFTPAGDIPAVDLELCEDPER